MLRRYFLLLSLLLNLAFISAITCEAQIETKQIVRERGGQMLENAEKLLKEHYFDRNYRGVNLSEKIKQAKAEVKKAETNAAVYLIVAEVLALLDDSHTTFIPPGYAEHVDYGIRMQMFGDKCHVVAVKKGSDAEVKGVKVGDEVAAFQTLKLARTNFDQLIYLFYYLNPLTAYKIALRNPNGSLRELEVNSTIVKAKDVLRENRPEKPIVTCHSLSAIVAACKLHSFVTDKDAIDKMMRQVSKHQKLILDLRGNGGGYVFVEEYLTGYFFDRSIQIGTEIRRGGESKRFSKASSGKFFGGELIVLIDGESASAAEVFARVVQLEKRGIVIGDRSAGAVMTSQFFPTYYLNDIYGNQQTVYGFNVTVADVLMSDGKSLEKIGVKPDISLVPNRTEINLGRDSVLSFAAEKFNITLSPAAAGKLFPPDDETQVKLKGMYIDSRR